MSWIANALRNLTQKRRLEKELTDEVDSYVALSVQEKMKRGASEAEARRAARVDLQGTEQVKEHVRDIRAGRSLERRWQDFRYATRVLRKSPMFSLTVIAVLTLGLGSTTLIFAIVDSMLLQGPRFPQVDRLFTVWQRIPEEPRVSFSPKEFEAWEKQTQLFEHLAFVTGTGFTLTGRGEPELVVGRLASPFLFETLGAKPALGRLFGNADSDDHLVVLSDSLWRRKFAARSDVVGEQLVLEGQPYTIVGVLPESFSFDGSDAALFVPARLSKPIFREHPDAHFLRVIGRLKPGVGPEQLAAEVSLLGTRVDDAGDQTKRRYFAVSLREIIAGDLRAPLLVLLVAVTFLLLIACANVANLTLARSQSRQSEIAIRAALGASRSRLIGQLLTESILLSAVGGAAGIAVAVWGLELLRKFTAQSLPQIAQAHVDGRAVFFALAAATVTAMAFGLGPAFSATRAGFQSSLSGATRSITGSNRTRQALVFGEIAVAAALLIASALMLRSFVALIHVDPGFRAGNVVTADLVLTKENYPSAAPMIRFYRDALDKIRALPGVESASVVTHLPFAGNSWGNGFEVEGVTPPAGEELSAQIRPVSSAYFGTLRIPLRQGRDFEARDHESAPGVAIVNEIFAKRFWPNESALGKRVRYDQTWLIVVGVCGNIKHARLEAASDLEIYTPYPQVPPAVMQFVGRDLNFVARSSQPAAIATEMRAALQALDSRAVIKTNTMEELLHDSVAQPRFRTCLIAIFSAFALILACLGVYGVIAYLVTQRYREIGIRLALGATRWRIFELILGRTVRLAAAGVAAGAFAAFFLARFLRTVLYGVSMHDAATFISVPLLLLVVALLAGYLPARRATRIDPVRSSLRVRSSLGRNAAG